MSNNVEAHGETDVWRPDAEPWEVLAEADDRAGNAGEDANPSWVVRMAEALSEMGWRLVPETHIKEALDEVKRLRARDDYQYLHHEEQCAHGSTLMRLDRAEERVRELEAENKRLKTILNTVRRQIGIAAATGVEPSLDAYRLLISDIDRAVAGSPAPVPVPEEPESSHVTEIGAAPTLRRVVNAIYDHVVRLRALAEADAARSPAPVPVPEEPEGDEVTGDAIAHLATLVRWVLDEADWSGGNERFVEPLEDALDELRDADADGSLAPEEPEGEKALRFLRELRAHLNDGLRTIEDMEEGGKLDDYWLGRQQELEAVSVWLKAVEEGLKSEDREPRYRIEVHEEDGGFWARADGAFATGDSLAQCLVAVAEAIDLMEHDDFVAATDDKPAPVPVEEPIREGDE